MVEASEENAYELLKIETMKRNNVRMIELGLPPLRLSGEDTLVKGKKAVKSPLATKYQTCIKSEHHRDKPR